jgi:toxin ParE1/3/4
MSSRRIVRRLVARFDVLEIVGSIAIDNPLAAARFTDAVRATEEVLLAAPGIGSSRDYGNPALAGMRFHLVKGFRKYLVFYITRSDGIEVVRVLHGARDLPAIFHS